MNEPKTLPNLVVILSKFVILSAKWWLCSHLFANISMGITIGLLIPLLGTMLGAAFVFFMKKDMSPKLQKSLLELIAIRLMKAVNDVSLAAFVMKK